MRCTATTARARSPARRACAAAPERFGGFSKPPLLSSEPDRISFEAEHVALSAPGRLEISGRWYGVRGRRFMRPALTVTRASDGGEVRALAELDHKPWDARDGELWTAAFAADLDPQDIAAAELAVAPDIAVPVAAPGAPAAGSGRRAAASGAAASQRLRERVAAATEALERERRRRAASEEALEAERGENRRLRMRLGQLEAELDLTRTAQEAAPDAAELEGVRRDLLQARTQLEHMTRERDRLAEAHADAERELHEQMGALESARDALEAALERERSAAEAAESPGSAEFVPAAARPPARADRSPGESSVGTPGGGVGPHPPRRPERPAHDELAPPSSTWMTRGLALLFLLAVIAAILLVISRTVS